MNMLFEKLGIWFLIDILMVPLGWLPWPCAVLLGIVASVFVMLVIGRILKFIWDALPIA